MSGPSAARPLDIAAQIKAAGLGCKDATKELAVEQHASCTLSGGEGIGITVYSDHAALEHGLALADDNACPIAIEDAHPHLTYVEGSNWYVETTVRLDTLAPDPYVPKIAAATGGQVTNFDCSTSSSRPDDSSSQSCTTDGEQIAPISGSPPPPKNWWTLSPAQLRAAGWRIVHGASKPVCQSG